MWSVVSSGPSSPVTKAGVVLATSASRKATRSPGRRSERRRHGLALAAGPARARHHPRPGVRGLGGGAVARPVVEHDHLVDQAVAPVPGQERLDDRPHDRSHRRGLVAGRDAHRHGALRALLGREDPLGREVAVPIGVRHAPDSSSPAALSGPARRRYHGAHHPERLRDGPVDVAATSAEHLVPMPDR